jgi:hypothetical protein
MRGATGPPVSRSDGLARCCYMREFILRREAALVVVLKSERKCAPPSLCCGNTVPLAACRHARLVGPPSLSRLFSARPATRPNTGR